VSTAAVPTATASKPTTTSAGGYHWINNILTSSYLAIHFETSLTPAQTTIQHNLIEKSTEVIWSSGTSTVASNVLIDSNAFLDNGNNDVHWDGSHNLSVKATGLVVTNNTSTDDAGFALLINTDGAKIENNTVTWVGGAGSAGITRVGSIAISSDNANTLISDNTITGAQLDPSVDPFYWDQFAITTSTGYGTGAPSVGVTITDNTLTGQVFGIALRNSAGVAAATGYVISNNTISSSPITTGGSCAVDASGYLDGGVGIFVQDQNHFPGATPSTMVQEQGLSITGNTITNPTRRESGSRTSDRPQ
jgi:hypothetical protein